MKKIDYIQKKAWSKKINFFIDLYMPYYFSDTKELTIKNWCKKTGMYFILVIYFGISRSWKSHMKRKYGIDFGIEIDCSDKGVGLDVIEYGINVDRNNFVKLQKTIENIFKAPFKTRLGL